MVDWEEAAYGDPAIDVASAGVEELMIQWFGVEDLEGIQVLAEQVLPHVVA